ncbi:class I SAM-dependent DNA methyltransferase [Streptomyces otsuchiensis]|uniref:class I SAM-dependent DNA methyltransferase n=1 Tax=Streptomyces otsuchiensis TaxID=2681388 RepID=UPI001032231F|nr:class I SAM-dependent methyltransferase [Streptomyces otsuchiensis]
MDDRDGYFGEPIAATYDDSTDSEFSRETIEKTAGFLAARSGGGRALELGVGTGRIALPLSRRGVPVHGIDLSRAMTARMRAKPGGDRVEVTIGDFATTRVGGGFSLAYLVFNTIMNLTTQDAQVECFRSVASQLDPGGRFVVEVAVPDLRRLPPGQDAVPFRVSGNGWAYDRYDPATQAMSSNYLTVTDDGRGRRRSIPFRYVWPAELDLMARLAGLRLSERWEGWGEEPFTGESTRHVSVWEKPAG